MKYSTFALYLLFYFYSATSETSNETAEIFELLEMFSNMSIFPKESFALHDFFNANSERMLRLSTTAGNLLAREIRKSDRSEWDWDLLQAVYNVTRAARDFYVPVGSSLLSGEFAYTLEGFGGSWHERQRDNAKLARLLEWAVEHNISANFAEDFVRHCGRFGFASIGDGYQYGPFATAEVIRERIVGEIYSDSNNCLQPTLRDAVIHAEVEAVFRELWYRIGRKRYFDDHKGIEAIQREYQVQLLEDEASDIRYKEALKYFNKTLPRDHVDQVERKLGELRKAVLTGTTYTGIDDALEYITCVHHRHFPNINPQWPLTYRYPEAKCYARASIVGNDYKRSAIYGRTRNLLKDIMETLVYGGLCLNVSNNGSTGMMERYTTEFLKLLQYSSHHLTEYAKTSAELFFPTIGVEVAKSAFGGSPIRRDVPYAIDSSNNSLANVAKDVYDALSARGCAEYDYQVVVATTYGRQEFYARCLDNTTDCFTVQSHMATNLFVTRHNVIGAKDRAVEANHWLIDHRNAIQHILSEFGTASTLDVIFKAMVNETSTPLEANGFRGVVLLRNWAFFGPADLHLAIHSPAHETTQLWDNVWQEDDAKWTTHQAHTISVIFLV